MRGIAKLVLLCTAALAVGSCGRRPPLNREGADGGQLYVTWDGMEPDKLASIWLIKRFVAPQARFEFVPKNTLITNGIPFDTPDSEFRRSQMLSCFESILQKHAITNAALLRIGEITHDIEINYWGEKRFRESDALNAELNAIIDRTASNPVACAIVVERVDPNP